MDDSRNDQYSHRAESKETIWGKKVAHLYPTTELLLVHGGEVLQRETVLFELFEHVVARCAGFDSDLVGGGVDTLDAIAVGHGEHGVVGEGAAVGTEHVATDAQRRAEAVAFGEHALRLLGGVGLEQSRRGALVRCGPVGEVLALASK